MKERNKPGVMIYFDDFESIDDEMTDKQMGRFIRAIVHYSRDGELTDFSDDALLRIAFKSAKPKIDRDSESYQAKLLQKSYAGYCSSERKKNCEPLDFEEWLQQNQQPLTPVGNREQPLTPVNGTQRNQPIAITMTTTMTTTRGCKGEEAEPVQAEFPQMNPAQLAARERVNAIIRQRDKTNLQEQV